MSMGFDGVDDTASFNSTFIFHALYGDATLEFWLKAPHQDHWAIFWTRGDATDTNRFHFYTALGDDLGLDYRDPNGNIHYLLPADGTFTFPDNAWVHVAVTRVVEPQGSHTYRFYKDGTLVYTATDTNPNLPTSTVWTIAGRGTPPHQGFTGLLDEIRMTSSALSPDQFLDAPLRPAPYCTAKVNSLGCMPAIDWNGSPSLSGPDNFYVTAATVLNNKTGIMFWGGAQASVPFHGGIRCVASPFIRTHALNSGGNPPPNDCSGSYSFHFSQAYMASHLLSSGDTVYAQFWSRDPGFPAPDNIGLTDGLQFTICP
jgi:hypothetical protein